MQGFIDRKGEFVILCQWDWVERFSEGLAQVKKDDKWGYIDRQGKLIIPCQYKKAGSFSEGLAYVVKKGEFGYIDKQGKQVIKPNWMWDSGTDFSEGMACIWKGSKVGVINKQGEVVIPFEWKSAEPFKDGVIMMMKSILRQEYYLLDKTGKILGRVEG